MASGHPYSPRATEGTTPTSGWWHVGGAALYSWNSHTSFRIVSMSEYPSHIEGTHPSLLSFHVKTGKNPRDGGVPLTVIAFYKILIIFYVHGGKC